MEAVTGKKFTSDNSVFDCLFEREGLAHGVLHRQLYKKLDSACNIFNQHNCMQLKRLEMQSNASTGRARHESYATGRSGLRGCSTVDPEMRSGHRRERIEDLASVSRRERCPGRFQRQALPQVRRYHRTA